MTDHNELLELVKASKTIAFLTGAGVSTNSGIPDFQTFDELWPFEVDRATAINIEFFNRDRAVFWEAFRYIFLAKTAESIQPNSFHRAVANLEKNGKDVVVLTQNVDGLHTAAGTSQVLEMHGNIREVICNRPSCPHREPLTADHGPDSRCPRCSKPLRPDVVLFGEYPRGLGDAKQVCIEADLLVVAGTSLEVAPASDLPRMREWYYPESNTLWVNKSSTPYGYMFSHRFHGDLADFSDILGGVR